MEKYYHLKTKKDCERIVKKFWCYDYSKQMEYHPKWIVIAVKNNELCNAWSLTDYIKLLDSNKIEFSQIHYYDL